VARALGVLFVRGIERADRLQVALAARGGTPVTDIGPAPSPTGAATPATPATPAAPAAPATPATPARAAPTPWPAALALAPAAAALVLRLAAGR
jgi:2-oxoglutarate dehydrogenase E1 component